jgi:putative ABC transport system substrate-binding protein
MRRREFVAGIAALAGATALRALAQTAGRTYRIGALFGGGAGAMQLYRSALQERLASHGFVVGRNLRIDARGAPGYFHEDRDVARELLAGKPDAIFTCTAGATRAALAATTTVPVVFAWVTDPVALGFVQHFAKPGGNATGASSRFGELLVKRLELARELLPRLKRIAAVGMSTGRTTPPWRPHCAGRRRPWISS